MLKFPFLWFEKIQHFSTFDSNQDDHNVSVRYNLNSVLAGSEGLDDFKRIQDFPNFACVYVCVAEKLWNKAYLATVSVEFEVEILSLAINLS